MQNHILLEMFLLEKQLELNANHGPAQRVTMERHSSYHSYCVSSDFLLDLFLVPSKNLPTLGSLSSQGRRRKCGM